MGGSDQLNSAFCNRTSSHGFELAPKANLELAFAGGWGDSDSNRYFFDVDDRALNDGNMTIRLALPLWEKVELVPSLSYTWLWDTDIERGALDTYGEDDHLWGGLTVRVEL